MGTVPGMALPTVGQLVGLAGSSDFTGSPWCAGETDTCVRLYRYGRQALLAAIKAIQGVTGDAEVTAWFPSYICNEAVEPLRHHACQIRFYIALPDLTPNWDYLANLLPDDGSTGVLVLVHYFGFPNAGKAAREFCGRHNMVLVEDLAHVLRPLADGMGYGDLKVFSPRKLLPVPAGGILVASEGYAPHIPPVVQPTCTGESATWLGKRFLQRLLVELHIPWHRLRGAGMSAAGAGGETSPKVQPGCDWLSARMLAASVHELDAVHEKRRRNYQRLSDWLQPCPGARPLFNGLPSGVCPFAFPLWVKGGSQSVSAALKYLGVPAGQWPNLPPEVTAQPTRDPAVRLFEQVLLLPVHQSLKTEHIDHMGKVLSKVLAGR